MRPSYGRIYLTFARNSLIRDMSFRFDFFVQSLTSIAWAIMNWGLFKIIYQHTQEIGRDSGWHQQEFFVFLGSVWIVNSLMQTFFMGNAEEFSESIRTGNLDFALLKPVDTQFLITFPRINWSQLPNGVLGAALVIYSLMQLKADPSKELSITVFHGFAYLLFMGCGLLILYSVMIGLASTSIWLGRNQNLYDFWFYITNFYRYPMEIYMRSGIGMVLWAAFMFVIPILVVSNVPARILAQPLGSSWKAWEWCLAGFTLFATFVSLAVSRWIFHRALMSYRSASS